MMETSRSRRKERETEVDVPPQRLLICIPVFLCLLWAVPDLVGQEDMGRKVPDRVLSDLRSKMKASAREEGHQEKWERYSEVIRKTRGYLLEYGNAKNVFQLHRMLLTALQARINLEADAESYKLLLKTARKLRASKHAPLKVKLEADLVLMREKLREPKEETPPPWRLIMRFVGRYEGTPALGKALLYAARAAESENHEAVLQIVQKELRDRRAFWDHPMATGFVRRRTDADLSGRTLNTVMKRLDGTRLVAPRDLLGTVSVLHFWAGSSPQSLKDIDRLKSYYKKQKDRLDIVGIGMDPRRGPLQRAISKHDLPWTQTFSGEGPNDPTALNYGVFGLPSVIYLDPLGRTRFLRGMGGHYGREPSTALRSGYGEVVRKANRIIRGYETHIDAVKNYTSGTFLDRMTGGAFTSSASRKLYKDYQSTNERIAGSPKNRQRTRRTIREFIQQYEGEPSEPAATILGGLLAVQAGRDGLMHEIGNRLAEEHTDTPQVRSFLRYVLDRHTEVGRSFEADLTKLDGSTLSLPEDLNGNVRVICFWDASSMQELTSLREATSELDSTYPYTGLSPGEHEDLEVIGVHLGQSNEQAKKIIKERPDWIHTRISKPENHPLLTRLDLYERPSIWVIGRDGRIRANDMLSAHARSPILAGALNQPAPSRVRGRVAGPWRVLGPFKQQKVDGLTESGYMEPPDWIRTDAARRSWMVTTFAEMPWHGDKLERRFSRASFPVIRGEKELDFGATYDDGSGGEVGWRVAETDGSGFVNLNQFFNDDRPLPFAYAVTYVHSSSGGTYHGTYTGTDTGILRVNGVEKIRHIGRNSRISKDEVWAIGQGAGDGWQKKTRFTKMPKKRRVLRRQEFRVRLRKGWNEITLKTWDVWGDWRFQLRFHDPDRTLRYALAPSLGTGAHPGSLPRWEPPEEDDHPGQLLERLDGTKADAILAAANALGDLPDAKELLRAFRTPPRIDVRRLIVASTGGAVVRKKGRRRTADTLKLLHAVQALHLWKPSDRLRDQYPDRSPLEIVLHALKPDKLYEPLINGLKKSNGSRKKPYIRALGMLGDRRAVPVLIDELRDVIKSNPDPTYETHDRNIKMRGSILRALGRLGDPEAADVILEVVDNNQEGFRLAALKALVRIGDSSSNNRLIQALKKPDKFAYGGQVIEEMGRIDHPDAVKWLEQETRSHFQKWPPEETVTVLGSSGKRPEPRALIRIRALARHGEQNVVDELLAFLKHKKMKIRRHAMEALGRVGEPEAVPALIDELADPASRELRHYAVRALERIGDPSATEPVASLLEEPSYGLRVLAARALRSIDNKGDAIPDLIQALQDDHWLVRVTAAETLGALKATDAVDPLIDALQDSNSSVRAAAAGALKQIGANRAREALVDVLADWQAGPPAAEALDQFGWTPEELPAHRVHYRVANRNGSALLKNWKATKKVLYKDLKQGGEPAINAAFALIALGKESSISRLMTYLNENKPPAVAVACLNSENEKLADRVEKWAKKNGRRLQLKRRAATVEWGKWK